MCAVSESLLSLLLPVLLLAQGLESSKKKTVRSISTYFVIVKRLIKQDKRQIGKSHSPARMQSCTERKMQWSESQPSLRPLSLASSPPLSVRLG